MKNKKLAIEVWLFVGFIMFNTEIITPL